MTDHSLDALARVPDGPDEGPPAGRSGATSLTEAAYERLKAQVIEGRFHPGDQYDLAGIAERLGLGRTPVREALLRLQGEGIVRFVPKRGLRIVPLTADDLTEIYQVISAVEVEAVALLAQAKPAKTALAGLTAAAERMAAAAEAGDREAWALADEAFHRGLLALCPNRRLRDVGLAQRDLAQRAHFVALRLLSAKQQARSARRHRKLVKLLAAGDVEAAVAGHRGQRERGAALLVEVLRGHGLTRL